VDDAPYEVEQDFKKVMEKFYFIMAWMPGDVGFMFAYFIWLLVVRCCYFVFVCFSSAV
jgi:hypothetical protein